MAPVALRDYFAHLVQQGGPEPEQYDGYNRWAHHAVGAVRDGVMSAADLECLLDSAGDATSSPRTMQGFVRVKPHGYAGDFEVIDRIYQNWLSPDPSLVKWDRFFHAQAAPRAVRNRKTYFHAWLREAETSRHDGLKELRLFNVGSGPARDVCEYFESTPESRIICTCVDHDSNAIAHASTVCASQSDKVHFQQANALKFRPIVTPHFIWSAGLFDYLDDRLFAVLRRRLWRMLAPGGEIVIGNFSSANPTRAYMELGGWQLNERDPAQLLSLAKDAGVSSSRARVEHESEGVNLFLHLEK